MKDPAEFSDICTHLGDEYERFHGAIAPPIFQNTVFTRKTANHGYSYTRDKNPTTEILEQKLAALERAEAARVYSSGMAAITSLLFSLLKTGDRVLTLGSVYYPVTAFLRNEMARYGVETDFLIDGTPEEFEASIRPGTKLFYLESPTSHVFKVLDLRKISALAKRNGITTVMDNTWATPLFQNPLRFGIDYCVHSATKYLGGHGDVCAGAVVASAEKINQLAASDRFCAAPDPFASWLLIRSLRTLELRMRRHGENARRVAEFLSGDGRVRQVLWPGLISHAGHEVALSQMSGFSGLMSFTLDADVRRSYEFVKRLDVFEEGPSWGGYESLVNAPGMNADEDYLKFASIPKGLIRISVGLEHADSIINDLRQSLDKL